MSQTESNETTVDKVTAEPPRHGEEFIPGRQTSRVRVMAADLNDADIDRLIKQAQQEVDPITEREMPT